MNKPKLPYFMAAFLIAGFLGIILIIIMAL